MEQKNLFYSLTEDVKNKKFDDDYLFKLIEFWQTDENKTDGNIFYASYALDKGNYEVALEYAESAVKKKKNQFRAMAHFAGCLLAEGG